MSVNFEKANINRVDIIFGWLSEPFVQEFCRTIPEYYERLGWKKIGMDEFKSHPVTVMEVVL